MAGENQLAQHAVGAVDQGQTLLLGQRHRLDAGVAQGRAGRPALAARVAHESLTHHRERAMRQRGQVARTAERPELVHDRRDPRVEQGGVGFGHHRTNPGAARGQRRQPQQHHRADDLALDLGPRPGCVRADQASLQVNAPIARNVPGGQGAEPGRDAVDRTIGHCQRLDALTRGGQCGQRVGRERHPSVVAGDSHHLVTADRAHTDPNHADLNRTDGHGRLLSSTR